MTDKKPNRFDIDDEGYKQQIKDVKPYRLCNDMVQNCLDEDSITNFQFNIKKNTADGLWEVKIDDNGDGFLKTSDIYTLFGDSYKRADHKKRGQFNEGDKRFFASCVEGQLRTKDIVVVFPKEGGRIVTKQKTPAQGTHVIATFKWTKKDVESVMKSLTSIIVDKRQKFMLNGENVPSRESLRSFDARLYTSKLIDGRMTPRKEDTMIDIFQVPDGDDSWLYEMGIPVCTLEQNIKWHVNINQKLPQQTTSRNVVSEKYLQSVYESVLNNTVDLVEKEDASATWIQEGMKGATEETAKEVFKKVYDTDEVYIQSQTDPRANEKAIESGGQLIKRNWLDSDAREHLKDIGVISYASETFKTNYASSEQIEPNEDMIWFERVTLEIMKNTLDSEIPIFFVKSKEVTDLAWMAEMFGCYSLTFNTSRLGKQFFKEYKAEQIALVIHELAHKDAEVENGMSHLSHKYIDETIRIGSVIAEKGIQYYIDKVDGK